MEFEKEKFISEIHLELLRIKDQIPIEFDGKKLHRESTLPDKLANINYSLSYRYQHLGTEAIKLIEENSFLASAILVRSLMETAALLWFTDHKIQSFIDGNLNLNVLNDFLNRIRLGSKENDDSINTFHILDPIRKIQKKENELYQDMYQKLSEYAHPNFAGTAGFFSKHVSEGIKIYGENMMEIPPFKVLYPFGISMHLLIKSHDSIVKNIPVLASKL